MMKRIVNRGIYVNWLFLGVLTITLGILVLGRMFILDLLQNPLAKLVYVLIAFAALLGSVCLGTFLSKCKTVFAFGKYKDETNEGQSNQKVEHISKGSNTTL